MLMISPLIWKFASFKITFLNQYQMKRNLYKHKDIHKIPLGCTIHPNIGKNIGIT